MKKIWNFPIIIYQISSMVFKNLKLKEIKFEWSFILIEIGSWVNDDGSRLGLCVHWGWLSVSWLVRVHHWLIVHGLRLHAVRGLLGCVVHDDGGSSIVVVASAVDLCHGECFSGLFFFPPDNDGNDDNETDNTTDNSTSDGSGIDSSNNSCGVPIVWVIGIIICKVGCIVRIFVGAGSRTVGTRSSRCATTWNTVSWERVALAAVVAGDWISGVGEVIRVGVSATEKIVSTVAKAGATAWTAVAGV